MPRGVSAGSGCSTAYRKLAKASLRLTSNAKALEWNHGQGANRQDEPAPAPARWLRRFRRGHVGRANRRDLCREPGSVRPAAGAIRCEGVINEDDFGTISRLLN